MIPQASAGQLDLFAGVPADVLRTEQVADRLQLSPVTVRGLAAAGRIPARKVGQEWRYFWPAVVRAIFEGSIEVDGGTGGSTQRRPGVIASV